MTDWTCQDNAKLRALWDEGLSTAEIGRRMNLSKNAIVGKAHRLDLPARPSPIRKDGVRRQPKPRSRPKVTLAPLPASAEAAQPAAHPAARPVIAAPRAVAPSRPKPLASLTAKPPAGAMCRYPLWEDWERPTHRFCDDPAVRGAYCGIHANTCYVRLGYHASEQEAA